MLADSPPEPLHLEGERFGNYVLGRLLGQGGMGIVFEARDIRLGRTVALKILADDVHSSEVLLREAELAAALDHEHIVPIYEADEYEGIAYFTMKRIDGGVLETPASTECRAAEMTLAIARAIECAHRHGILHLDLKPANVLIDKTGRPFVTDFGIAALNTFETRMKQPRGGTPSYMAPEVLKGERGSASTAADIWGAGIVLYELLTGNPPFRASSREELAELITTGTLPPLTGVSADLVAICRRCLEKDPANRYATASDLVADLTRFLDGEPPSGRPWARRLYLFARHPLYLYAPIFCLLVSLFVWNAWGLTKREQLKIHTEQDLVYATSVIADSLAKQTAKTLRTYANSVEVSSRDKRLVETLSGSGSMTAPDLCAKLREEHDWPSTAWFLLDQEGRLVGRAPSKDDEAMGHSFTFRDYYRGAKEIERQRRQETYVSRAYRSAVDDDFKIALSIVVHNDVWRPIGMLVVTFPTGSMLGTIALPKAERQTRTIAILAPRDPGEAADESAHTAHVKKPAWVFLVQPELPRGAEVSADVDWRPIADDKSAFTRIVPIEGTLFHVYVRMASDELVDEVEDRFTLPPNSGDFLWNKL